MSPGSAAARASVKLTPVAEKSRLPLVIVKSRVTVPPGGTGSSVNDFVRESGVTVTSRVALALPASGIGMGSTPMSISNVLVTLSSMPVAVAVTSTVTVQVAPAPAASDGAVGREPMVWRKTTLVPAVAVNVVPTGPLQVVAALAGSAMTIPAGRLSVKRRSFAAAAPMTVLSMVKVSVLRPPRGTELGEKLLVKPGKVARTIKSSVAVPLLPAEDVRSPDVLVWVPTVPEVTLTLTVHTASLPPSRPPVKLMVPPPSGALTTPSRQVVEPFAGSAIVTAPGRMSVNARLVTGVVSPFVIVNTSIDTLPGPMLSGVNTLEKVGTVDSLFVIGWADTVADTPNVSVTATRTITAAAHGAPRRRPVRVRSTGVIPRSAVVSGRRIPGVVIGELTVGAPRWNGQMTRWTDIGVSSRQYGQGCVQDYRMVFE